MFISTAANAPLPSPPQSISPSNVVVPMPENELKNARLHADGFTNIMLKASPLIAVGIIVAEVVLAKSGAGADTTLAVGCWVAGAFIAAALVAFAYGRWMSKHQLKIINTRISFAVEESCGVTLEPLGTISVRDTFTSGTDRDGAVSLWAITVGQDFIGARRAA